MFFVNPFLCRNQCVEMNRRKGDSKDTKETRKQRRFNEWLIWRIKGNSREIAPPYGASLKQHPEANIVRRNNQENNLTSDTDAIS